MQIRIGQADIEAIARAIVLKLAETPERLRSGEKSRTTKAVAPDNGLVVSYGEAARLLDVSERTIWTLCQDGKLNVVAIGRARRVLRSSIQAFLESQSKSA